jgi:hypothetical protein
MHCDLWRCFALSLPPPPLHHCFLAKNINKTIELLKYKIYQKASRNRPKEQSNFSIVLRVKLTGLAFVEFVVVSTGLGQKRAKEPRKNWKDTGIPKT